jgi:cytochrome c556
MAFSRKYAIAGLLMIGVASAALGQTDPIKARRAIMKANGAAIGALVKTVKGETPFDADAAKAALQTIHNSATIADLFPAGSDQGDTNALPKIWADTAGFQAALGKLIAADEAQLANPPADVAGIKAALGALGPACTGCHNAYRAPT